MCYAWIPMALQIATAAVGVMAYQQQGQAQAEAAEYEAQVLERNAQAVENEKALTRDAAAIERRRLGERIRAEKGDLTAKYAHMGLDPGIGTPADLVGDVARAGRTDAFIIGRNEITELGRLDKEQADYLAAADQARRSGKAALKGAALGGLGSFLGSASNVSPRWIQPQRQTPLRVSTAPHTPMSSSSPSLLVGGG